MNRHDFRLFATDSPRSGLFVAGLILALLVTTTTGCSTNGSSSRPFASSSMPAKQAPASSKMAMMAKSTEASGMVCTVCSGKGMAKTVAGEANVENGVQVLRISLKDGRYVPNAFTVQASLPVRASFDGTATGCLGHPTFKSLGKAADVTKSSAAIDLGMLKPGTYKFSCAMGMNSGTITVQ